MKGISQIVLMLLILVIAILSISVLWLYFSGLLVNITSSGNTSTPGNTLSSCMNIDSVKGNTVYLRNCGDGTVTNSSLRVYFDNAPVNFSMSPLSLGKGQIGIITLYGSWDLSAGENYKLKITTPSAEVERFVKVVYSNAPSEIIYLKFDEGSGNITYDSSSNHNDGTLQNIYPSDDIAPNPSLEDPWRVIASASPPYDVNHTTNAPWNWGSDTSFYNISTTTMLGQKETSIVKDGSSAFNMTFKSAGAFSGSFCLFSNDTQRFPINESQYLEGGDFRYIIKGETSYCDQSVYFYNDSGFMCRRWSNESYLLDNVDGGGGWLIKSYVWMSSSLSPYPSSTCNTSTATWIPYIPQGAKYALFQQYLVYQGSNQDWQAMFDKFFVYQWPSMPTNNQRISRASSGWTNGKFGKALYFDGYNDYVNASHIPQIDNNAPFTISFWMYLNNSNPEEISIVKEVGRWGGTDSSNLFAVGASGNGWPPNRMMFEIWDASGVQHNYFGNTILQNNLWYYLTYVFDKSSNKIRFYLNGTLDNETNYNLGTPAASQPLTIGQGFGSSMGNFTGIIDEVRIWDGALTQQEIQTVMNGGQIVTGGTPSLTLGELT